ncbi:MAG: dihydroneopterin aldolase [Spirochaetes bacterium]|nr:dihydroneopterin aldolase [Spirochaetota bacterium]
MKHRITMERIDARVHIGVTEKEIRHRQRISVSLVIVPRTGPGNIDDCIDKTVNYSAVRQDVLRFLKREKFGLIETAAEKILELVASHHSIETISVTVTKYPYRDTRSVSYTIET